MPFYKKLVDERDERKSRSRVIVVSLEPKESLADYLAAHGLRADVIAGGLNGVAKLHYTPTLIFLDSQRHVKHVWTGKLSPEDEARALEALQTVEIRAS